MKGRTKRIVVESSDEDLSEFDHNFNATCLDCDRARSSKNGSTFATLDTDILFRVFSYLPARDMVFVCLTCSSMTDVPNNDMWRDQAIRLGETVRRRLKDEDADRLPTWKNSFFLASGFACSECLLLWDWKLPHTCVAVKKDTEKLCGKYLCEDCSNVAVCCSKTYCLDCMNFICCSVPTCPILICNNCQLTSAMDFLPKCKICGTRQCKSCGPCKH